MSFVEQVNTWASVVITFLFTLLARLGARAFVTNELMARGARPSVAQDEKPAEDKAPGPVMRSRRSQFLPQRTLLDG